jgi:hypothetical protein
MTRIGLLSVLACTAVMAAVAGCGGTSAAGSRDGGAGSDGAAGAGGSAATGAGGAGAGGSGAGGSSATGAGGSSATGAGGSSATGAGGATGTGGADGGLASCTPGTACTDGESCSTTMGCGNNRERACFCDPNGQLACETCQAPDGGTGGTTGNGGNGGGMDAGTVVATCPSGVTSGMACATQGDFCTASCAGGQRQTCFCTRAGRADGGTVTWNCLRTCTVP